MRTREDANSSHGCRTKRKLNSQTMLSINARKQEATEKMFCALITIFKQLDNF